jgi:hypothetical protein
MTEKIENMKHWKEFLADGNPFEVVVGDVETASEFDARHAREATECELLVTTSERPSAAMLALVTVEIDKCCDMDDFDDVMYSVFWCGFVEHELNGYIRDTMYDRFSQVQA